MHYIFTIYFFLYESNSVLPIGLESRVDGKSVVGYSDIVAGSKASKHGGHVVENHLYDR